MTSRIGNRCKPKPELPVSNGVHDGRTRCCRGRGIVVSTLGATALAAVLTLASAPTSFAFASAAPGFAWDGSTGSHTMSGQMPGMDHGHETKPGATPAPTMSGDMPGMDHGHETKPGATPAPTMSGQMPGMDHGSGDKPGTTPGHGDNVEVVADRPLAPVLGVFGGGSAAVMLTAGFLRRRDRAAKRVKEAARAARRTQK